MWRYFETWQTDLCRAENPSTGTVPGTGSDWKAGALVPVDGWAPKLVRSEAGEWVPYLSNIWRESTNWTYRLNPAQRTLGSPWPAPGWEMPDFDDSQWTAFRCSPGTNPGWLISGDWIMRFPYRSLALICLRGRFDVLDPARATEVTLNVRFQGGAVAYLNGREIGRAFLPEGRLAADAPAQDYPREAFVRPDGYLIANAVSPYDCLDLNAAGAGQPGKPEKPAQDEIRKRLELRTRALSVRIPPSALRKGVNVLAIEVHRAPAGEDMFLRNISAGHYAPLEGIRGAGWWNRVALEGLSLTTTAGADAIVPNVTRPRGVRISNQPVSVNVAPLHYSDPNETLGPVRIVAARNGAYAGQVFVSSTEPIRGLSVSVTDLKGAKVAIPASAVEIGYAHYAEWLNGFDGLEPSAQAELSLIECWRNKYAVQPVWVTVRIPRDVPGGEYTGKITITADGLDRPVETPLQVNVVGNWVLPASQDFTTYVGLIQSPESVAMQYEVPLWSEAHWKLLDRTFELLGQLGNKDVFIPLVSETYLGNEHTMATWVKQPASGGYKIDFANVERYLDLALKHCGRVPNVCVIANYGLGGWNMTGTKPHPQTFTVLDPATRQSEEVVAPAWGTPEALTFWRPVFEQLRDILAKRGLENSLTIYSTQFCDGKKEGWKDLSVLVPGIRFTGRSHYDYGAPAGGKWYYLALMIGAGVYWDPDEDAPYYGWREPLYVIASGRGGGQFKDFGGYTTEHSALAHYRMLPEMTVLSGVQGRDPGLRRSYLKRGFGQWGADFWPVVKSRVKGGGDKLLCQRFNNEGSTSMEQTIFSVIGQGREAPVPTLRMQMLREGLQETEARIFVQNALLDHADRLGPALAKRCKEICDERSRGLRYCSEYSVDYILMPQAREELTVKLYQLAGDVSEALQVH